MDQISLDLLFRNTARIFKLFGYLVLTYDEAKLEIKLVYISQIIIYVTHKNRHTYE